LGDQKKGCDRKKYEKVYEKLKELKIDEEKESKNEVLKDEILEEFKENNEDIKKIKVNKGMKRKSCSLLNPIEKKNNLKWKDWKLDLKKWFLNIQRKLLSKLFKI